jgi:uncharacterized protein YecE (DUF72 family)
MRKDSLPPAPLCHPPRAINFTSFRALPPRVKCVAVVTQGVPTGQAAVVRIGCAGWSIPRVKQSRFPETGSHLERYASVLPAVEINSSFYRPHRPATYARWAATVPAGFRFAVKLPKAITHLARLEGAIMMGALDAFLEEVDGLGERLGPLLDQLPPSLRFDADVASGFFGALRARFEGSVVCEPRHPSWFTDEAHALLTGERIARVAADPAPVPAAAEPGGWSGLIYFRLHGSPKRYYSAYPE